MTLAFSRQLALGAGLFLPAIETWRRWGQFGQISKWPVIFDDFLAGGFLVLSTLVCRRSLPQGRLLLAGAWGAAVGMMYGSFFSQLVELGEPDPSGVPSVLVVAFKALLLGLSLAGLVGALRTPPSTNAKERVPAGR